MNDELKRKGCQIVDKHSCAVSSLNSSFIIHHSSFLQETQGSMAKRRSPLVIIFITIFIDLIGFGIVIPVLPLYAERYHASETVIGLMLASYSMMQFIFAPILGRLSDRVGR